MESTEAIIRLGTQGWGWQHWVGRFYPPGTRPEEYLAFYSRVFDTVEIDTTFYGIPKRSTVLSWAKKVPDGFRFTAKMPRVISHANGLEGGYEDLTRFLQTMSLLGDKLGPILVQLPPTFGYHFIASVARVTRVVSQVDEVYGFFNDRYGGHAPGTVNLLREILGLPLVDPRSIWPPQLGMFGE